MSNQWVWDCVMCYDVLLCAAVTLAPPSGRSVSSPSPLFFFLSGGRGDNGSPIIVFPEFPAFGEITDREFHNVLTYLTSVPRYQTTHTAPLGHIYVKWMMKDGEAASVCVSASRWQRIPDTSLQLCSADEPSVLQWDCMNIKWSMKESNQTAISFCLFFIFGIFIFCSSSFSTSPPSSCL